MSQDWLTEEQLSLLKDLKSFETETNFNGFPDIVSVPPIQSNVRHDMYCKQMFEKVEYDNQHEILLETLIRYRNKSQQIYRVGELIKDYDQKFNRLIKDKEELLQLIKKMKGETSEIVGRQKKMIDLSMAIKESLDYYSYHDKFEFNFPCEVQFRQMFQDLLQPTLSELTDGVQFFEENTTFVQSKRYLGMFQSSRSKILSFVKSFFIKLFSKQSAFVTKNAKNSLSSQIDSLYPKSKIKFVTTFLLYFPQFHKFMKYILMNIKETSIDAQLKYLELKQVQIEEFKLTENNISLIGYIQRNMPEIYDQAVLQFFTHYRFNFHQNLLKTSMTKKDDKFVDLFRQKYLAMTYIVCAEYAYLNYCCRVKNSQKSQFIKTCIKKLAQSYSQDLIKLLKDIRNKYPFELCQKINQINSQFPRFLEKHLTQEYQSFVFGCVIQFINQPNQIKFLNDLFDLFAKRYQLQMESLCFNALPKMVITGEKNVAEEQVKLLIQYIPKLKFCQNNAERYMIGALDAIIKSIRNVNTKIESRFACYIWNIEIFSNIKASLRDVKVSLVRKQLKLDMHNSTNIIQRFKHIERTENIIKYAQDIFNVIKTGMPVIHQLTMDFTKYIHEHYLALESQFVKDILFIYAKNMIQFLQKLTATANLGESRAKQICQLQTIQSLYSSYILSIERYMKDGKEIMSSRSSLITSAESEIIVQELLGEVYERLFDLLDNFYISTSKYVSYTETFLEIGELKKQHPKFWSK